MVALALRLWGLAWQLPDLLHSDELKYALTSSRIAAGLGAAPVDYRNPSLFRHLLNLEYRLLAQLGASGPTDEADIDSAALAERVLLGRLNATLLAVGSVALLYVAGRTALGSRSALLAAALLAVNFLHVYLSHFSQNDVPAGFFLVAALLPSVRLLTCPSAGGLLLAGLLGGLAAATKYNFGIVLVVPLTALALGVTGRRASGRLLLTGPLLLGAGALGGFLLGMPETIRSFSDVRSGLIQQAALGEHRWPGQEPDPVAWLYARALLQAFGLPAVLACLTGMAMMLWRRVELALTLAIAPLLYLSFMATESLFFARFALPLVPFVCLFAGYGLACLWPRHGASRPRAILAAAGYLLAIGPAAVLSARLDLLAGQTDTRGLARQWVQANVPPGTKLAAQSYALPIIRGGDELSRTYVLTTFYTLPDQRRVDELACEGNRFALISSYQEDRQPDIARRGDLTGYQVLRERGQLLATFWPGPDMTSVPTNVDDDGLPYWQIARYARPGSTIQVYALPAGAC